MNQPNTCLLTLFGIVQGLLLTAVPAALSQTRPGWQEWQPVASSSNLPFDAGFSNLELGGYLDFEDACKQAAIAANATPTYWYRLSNLVWQIGTGRVEYGCKVEEKFVATHPSTAVQRRLAERGRPVCLQVQSDVGNGVRLRQEPTLSSPQVGSLVNGHKLLQETLPALILTDSTGRQWLAVQQGALDSWASLTAQAGEHVNFRLCDSLR